MKKILCWIGIHDWRGLPLNWRVRQCARCLKVGFKASIVMLALLLVAGSAFACPSVPRRFVHQQVVVPALVTPVLVPTYSVAYNADYGAILEELRRIREALEANSGKRPDSSALFHKLVTTRCAGCHTDGKAEKAGFVLLEKDGSLPPLSLAEKRRIDQVVADGSMPPKSPLPEAEKTLVKEAMKRR